MLICDVQIVTIIFLPLSFIAAFFTINIDSFPTVGNTNNLPLSFVAKYLFGISFAISLPFVILALNLDRISDYFHITKRKWRQKKAKRLGWDGTGHLTTQDTADREVSVETYSGRKSEQRERMPYLQQISSIETAPLESGLKERSKMTAFRLRKSADIERGI